MALAGTFAMLVFFAVFKQNLGVLESLPCWHRGQAGMGLGEGLLQILSCPRGFVGPAIPVSGEISAGEEGKRKAEKNPFLSRKSEGHKWSGLEENGRKSGSKGNSRPDLGNPDCCRNSAALG